MHSLSPMENNSISGKDPVAENIVQIELGRGSKQVWIQFVLESS